MQQKGQRWRNRWQRIAWSVEVCSNFVWIIWYSYKFDEIFDFRLITKLPIFDMGAKKLPDIEMVEKSLNQLKEEYVIFPHFTYIKN